MSGMQAYDVRKRSTDKEREAAITLYLEGDDFRRIARILIQIYGKLFHNQTLMNWIKKAGLKVLKEMSKVKIDELHMYIKWSEEYEFGRW